MDNKVDEIIDAAWMQYTAARDLSRARADVTQATMRLELAMNAHLEAKLVLRSLEKEHDTLRDVLADIAIAGGGQ